MIISQYTFNYIGDVQQFTVPDTAYYRFEVWGAQGGSKNNNGAKGGYSKGRMYLIKGQTIYIYVGACPNCNTIWNGGGYSTYSGGDASDIRIGGTSLSNRVIVAGGGGGWYGGGAGECGGYNDGGGGGGSSYIE